MNWFLRRRTLAERLTCAPRVYGDSMLGKKLRLELLVVIIMGTIMANWAMLNVLGITSTNSDLFWAMFGATAAIEATIEYWFDTHDEQQH